MSNYSNLNIDELVALLSTPLGASSHLRYEIINKRIPSDVIDTFSEMQNGPEKAVFATFILDNAPHFKEFVDLEQVKLALVTTSDLMLLDRAPDEGIGGGGEISITDDYS